MNIESLESRLLCAAWQVDAVDTALQPAKAGGISIGTLSLLTHHVFARNYQEAVKIVANAQFSDASNQQGPFKFSADSNTGNHFFVGKASEAGVGSAEGALSTPYGDFKPLPPNQIVLAINDAGAGEGDYNDGYWRLNVKMLPSFEIKKVKDGSEEPAPPYADGTPEPIVYEVSRIDPQNVNNIKNSVTVDLVKNGGTAQTGRDFISFPTHVTIPSGALSVKFSVVPIWHAKDTRTTTLLLGIKETGGKQTADGYSKSGYIVDPGSATGTITPYFFTAIVKREKQEEGDKNHVYLDKATPKNYTIGIGHNMGPFGKAIGKDDFETITGANFNDVKAGREDLTVAQVSALFASDLDKAIATAIDAIPDFADQPLEIKIVVTDLIFNMGSLVKFPKFVQSISDHDYTQAEWDLSHKSRASNSLPSDYSIQLPNRFGRNEDLIQSVIDKAN